MQIKDQIGASAIPPLSRMGARAAAALQKVPLPALLCALVFAVLYPALGNGFVDWDDVQYVLSNPALRGSWLDALAFSPGYYHPLTTLTYKLEFVLFGPEPFPFHLTSLALHLANCASAYWLLTALGARRWAAFLGALLFGVHPVHVEPAAWVSGRKELLWGLFSTWTLIFYLRFVDTASKKFFIYSLVSFLLAMLSKPFAVVLPLALLLADHYRGRAFTARLLLEKVPYLAIALPLLTLSTGPAGFLLEGGAAGPLSMLGGAASVVNNAFFYAQKLILPARLSALYPAPGFPAGAVLLPALLLLSAFAASRFIKVPPGGAAGPGAGKKIFFGLGFFLLTLSPALIVSPPADRYVYLPALGLFFLYGEFLVWLYGAARGPGPEGTVSLAGRLVVLLAAAHFFALGFASARRAPVWKNSLALWEDVLRNYPMEYMGYYGRGNARAAAGDYGKALPDFTRCLELAPRYWKALNNRARLFSETKEFDKAIADYGAAIAINPGEPRLFLNRGNAYLLKGEKARAVEDYDRALAIAPGFPPALENRKRAAAGLRGANRRF